MAMSINILKTLILVVLRYSQISVQFLEEEELEKTLFTFVTIVQV